MVVAAGAVTLAQWVRDVRIGLDIHDPKRARRQLAARCSWLWRKGWVTKRQAERVKRLVGETR